MAWCANSKARGDFDNYDEWIKKFENKRTTDDCYTPPIIYDAVADWVANEYGVDRATFVRPFWPGADYETFEYPEGCIVVDNPPFSILKDIVTFYQKAGIPFFLFAPALTVIKRYSSKSCCVCVGVGVTYDNGANVSTSFVTSLDDARVISAPTLYDAVKEANEENLRDTKPELPRYEYPDNVVTAAMVNRFSKYGVPYRLDKRSSYHVSVLDAQKPMKKSIFGSGYLISERAAAERAAAERACEKRAIVWELSDREREIVASLGENNGHQG